MEHLCAPNHQIIPPRNQRFVSWMETASVERALPRNEASFFPAEAGSRAGAMPAGGLGTGLSLCPVLGGAAALWEQPRSTKSLPPNPGAAPQLQELSAVPGTAQKEQKANEPPPNRGSYRVQLKSHPPPPPEVSGGTPWPPSHALASAACSPCDRLGPSATSKIAGGGFLHAIIIYDRTAGEPGCGHTSPAPCPPPLQAAGDVGDTSLSPACPPQQIGVSDSSGTDCSQKNPFYAAVPCPPAPPAQGTPAATSEPGLAQGDSAPPGSETSCSGKAHPGEGGGGTVTGTPRRRILGCPISRGARRAAHLRWPAAAAAPGTRCSSAAPAAAARGAGGR